MLLYVLCVMLLMCGCAELAPETDVEQGTSLTLMLRNGDIRLEKTRGVEDLDDDGEVSQLEEVVDGRRMYRLAVFLVSDGTVVASEVLEAGDSRFSLGCTEATVSFNQLDYSRNYQLYAVANYGEYDASTAGHLADIADVTERISIASSSSGLCAKGTPYPLSLKKDIVLKPGVNTVSGELVRTYARIRINIRNQSRSDLEITKLQFAGKFTQSTVDLFDEGGVADVMPSVTSDDAVTPFVQNTVVPGIGEDNSVAEATVFDAYMLESNGGTYQYTLGVKYSGGVSETYYSVASSYITNPNDVEDGGLYVIYNANARRYLYDNGSDALASAESHMPDGELDHNCVWRFIKVSGNDYRIESVGRSGYSINSSGVKNNTVPMVAVAGSTDYFTLSQTGSYTRYMLLRSTSSSYYLAVNNGGTPIGATSGNSRRFRLYRVTASTESSDVKHEADIPITTVDKKTGESVPMQKLNRNDFVNILVNVSYNDKSGEVEFEVSDWNEVDGEVTFE